MQPASSLESVMKSVESSQSSIGQGHVLNQEDQDHMELLENILSIPSWSEVGVKNWDYGVPGVDPSKISKSELSACLAGDNKPENKGVQDGATDPQIGDMVDDSYLFAQLQQQRSLLAEGSITQLIDRASSLGNSDAMNNQGVQGSDHLLQRLADDTNAGSMVSGMPMGMLSAVGQGPTRSEVGQPQPLLSSSWRQPFIGGVPMSLGQANPEMFLRETNSNGSHLYGRNEPLSTFMGRDGKSGVMFNVYGGPQPHLGQPRAPVQPSQQGNNTSQGLQSGQQAYRAQGSATQPQPVNPVSGQAPRPRVRARRGQATDPHSIAERLRRERIAERMKALQDLVPNANKTDKASMLDEIVDYVKFLQLQVKVLSMSRLGGAGAVPSLVADLPAESANSLLASTLSRSAGISHDGLANAERQVARLMDEDMGSAMQYLQSKGLCLMPISLATASGKVPLSALQSIGSGDNKQYTETSVSVATDRSSSGNTMGVSASGNGNSGGSSTGKMGMKDSKDGAVADKNGDGRQSSKSPKSLPKSSDEAQRRIQ